jgi:hypothetical protein
VDSYGPAIKAGGLSNPERMARAPGFFGEGDGEREAILAHETTHAIGGNSRTNDMGGYIGSQMFQSATNPARLKNAAHFEAVIRLINGEALPQIAAANADERDGRSHP